MEISEKGNFSVTPVKYNVIQYLHMELMRRNRFFFLIEGGEGPYNVHNIYNTQNAQKHPLYESDNEWESE